MSLHNQDNKVKRRKESQSNQQFYYFHYIFFSWSRISALATFRIWYFMYNSFFLISRNKKNLISSVCIFFVVDFILRGRDTITGNNNKHYQQCKGQKYLVMRKAHFSSNLLLSKSNNTTLRCFTYTLQKGAERRALKFHLAAKTTCVCDPNERYNTTDREKERKNNCVNEQKNKKSRGLSQKMRDRKRQKAQWSSVQYN